MIFDKELMFFDGDAGAATASDSIDLGPGNRHESLEAFFKGTGLTAGTALVLEDSADDTTFATKNTWTVAYTVLNGGYTFQLPRDIRQYARLTVTAGAGGTMMAGILKDVELRY